MSTLISDTTLELWRTGRQIKQVSAGWLSGHAVCCVHNGETVDRFGRGGFMPVGNGGINYHCFNCGFITGYMPGRHLPYKFRKLLGWLGADDNTIYRLIFDAIRNKDDSLDITPVEKTEIVIKARSLPAQALSITQLLNQYEGQSVPEYFEQAVQYAYDRNIDFEKYDFYWTPETAYNLNRRLIVPFYWQKNIIGYTARTFLDTVKPKYHNSYEPHFVFNVDQQLPTSKFVIVCEGPFDAMSIDGVAILGNECNESQADIIDSLSREVIVVPDQDKAGYKLIDAALEYNWAVSFPVWGETCKDINEAVCKYGKLFTLKAILDGKETNRLKIELKKKRMV